jgi:ATP/maltotriose-dependent transcriptional regulator MalT
VLARVDAAIAALSDTSDPSQIVLTSIASVFVDRMAGCRQAMLRVIRDGREGGAVTSCIEALTVLGFDQFWTGEWDEAQSLLDEAAALCHKHGYLVYLGPTQHVRAMIAAARGDYDNVRLLTGQLMQWAVPRQVGTLQWHAWEAMALAALGRGDFEDAYQKASKITAAGVLTSHCPYALWIALDLVEAAVRTGRHEQARAHAQALREAGVAEISSRLAVVVAGAGGIAAPDEHAVELFEHALAVEGAERWRYDRARIQLAYGERLRRMQNSIGARTHLTAALETFERLGARPWAERAGAELRASGRTRSRAGADARDELTPQEFEVATLAATGLSNKQIAERLFLSPRTVEFHLHRVFPKLGITSRAALRDALAGLDEHPGGA